MDVDIAVLSVELAVGTSSVPPAQQSVPCFPVTVQNLVISFSVEVAGTSSRWVQQTFLEPSCVLGSGDGVCKGVKALPSWSHPQQFTFFD